MHWRTLLAGMSGLFLLLPLAWVIYTAMLGTDSRCMTDQQCAEDMVCRTVETAKGGPRLRQCTLVGVRKEGEPCLDMPDSREEGLDGPSCLPTCEGRTCPEGQDCIRPNSEEGVSVCTQVYGQNCQETPCPEGQKCHIWNTYSHPREAWGTCLIQCGEEHTPDCPEGFV